MMPYYGNPANYSVIEDGAEYMLILDLGPWDKYKTITNAAEGVVEELAEQLGARRLFYVDSDNQTDEIIHKDGQFVTFRPGGPDGKR